MFNVLKKDRVLIPTPRQLAKARDWYPGHGLLILNTGLGAVIASEVYPDREGHLRYHDSDARRVFPLYCEGGLHAGDDPFVIEPLQLQSQEEEKEAQSVKEAGDQ